MKDCMGLALTGATTSSLIAFEGARDEFRCFIGDPVASLDAALAASPGMTMAHLFKAWLNLLGTEPGGLAVARECIAQAGKLSANDRERRHLHALRLLAAGQWQDAGRALEDLSLLYPHDLLALQAGHQIDFFTGDARMLRDRAARALPAWSRSMPGYHAVLSMNAFGLEETGDYAQAESLGRQSLEIEPRDGWAWHAVAHVLEMKNQARRGVEWLEPNAAVWSEGSFFAVHNWWHLALFQLELGNTGEVLRLYDEAIGGPGSSVVLDMIDQSAMLWRLQLRGIDVGERWDALAIRWAAVAEPGLYAFNDMHAMMAFAAAGRLAQQQDLMEKLTDAMERGDSNARFTHDVGYAAARAMQCFVAGDYGRCTDLLRGVRNIASRFGGSHAQRDVLDITLLEAARRAGNEPLAAALAGERARARPYTAPKLALAA
ncbi:MAG: tetratricopeptide repeat protein [Pseudomonadota bacterium]